MDRRIKYTRMVLNQSLVKYLKEKEINRITVKELCQDADVNRSTYYAHFTDPYDQLSKLKAELIADLTAYADEIDLEQLPPEQHFYQLLKKVLIYMESKRDIFRILLARNQDRDQQLEILNFLISKGLPPEYTARYSDEELKYLRIYTSTGCFGLFIDWLMSDAAISPEKLARLMADFTNGVLS